MDIVRRMMGTHPQGAYTHLDPVSHAVHQIMHAAEICAMCADTCLAEKDVQQLAQCIHTDLDCADICAATARVLGRQTSMAWEVVHAQLRACIVACRACAEDCAEHAHMHEHCAICEEACRDCVAACERVIQLLPQAVHN